MKSTNTIFALLIAGFIGTAHAEPSNYVGQENRDIKALSTEDVQSYMVGKGMGLAKAAELNGYPGPSHVLALGAQLGLTREQHQQTQALFDAMSAKASTVGKAIVEKERELDRRFAHRHIDQATLDRLTDEIGKLQGELRAAHLAAHLDQVKILTVEQTARYIELRGYSGSATSNHESHQH